MTASGLLPEVQALRAVAVMAVVLFHFWPNYVPGGFVGVDVFFVISGFLITGHIVRSLERDAFSFRSFYVRRARRLLPAACLVLFVTAGAVLALLPYSRWRDTMAEVLASAFYVQNWLLAYGGSDYFDDEGTAAQHYWSLSVEEQFYLFWPVTLMLLWLLSRRRSAARSARTRMLVGMTAVTAASLIASVVVTRSDPSLAYFATYTRVWEFGIGALLALLPRWTTTPALRTLTSWAGAAAVLASVLLFDPSMPFPGSVALLPVLGTAAVIGAGLTDLRWGTAPLARWAPAQFLGDISYSLYLWHWPVLIIVPMAAGVALSGPLKIAMLLACVVLATLTKVLLEDRLREPGPGAASGLAAGPGGQASAARASFAGPLRRPRHPAVVLLALLLGTVGVAAAGTAQVRDRAQTAQALETQAFEEQLPCFGAGALRTPGCEPPFGDALVPDPGSAEQQFTGWPENEACMVDILTEGMPMCRYGPADAETHIALVGDSHALHWYPALQEAADAEGWRVTTFLRGSCPANPAVTVLPDDRQQQLCAQWSREVFGVVADDPSIDVVLTAALNNKRTVPEDGMDSFESRVAGYEAAWSGLAEAGKRVVALRSTPTPPDDIDVLDCLAERDAGDCGRSRADAERESADAQGGDPFVAAVEGLDDPRITLADPWDEICGPTRCEAVVGNVVVYVDSSHLSVTYSRTLGPFLQEEITSVLT